MLEEITGYLELGLWQEANDLIEALPSHTKISPAVLVLRISIYQAAGSWELMAEATRLLTTVKPENPLHWLKYPQATLYVEGLPPSLKILETAARRFPQNAEVLYAFSSEIENGTARRSQGAP